MMPIFMKLPGIPGNVHNVSGLPGDGWIEISSFQWGIGRGIAGSYGSSADREGSTPSVGEIVVTKKKDKDSASLFKVSLGGLSMELEVSIVFIPHGPSGPHHTLKLIPAVITDIMPCYPQGCAYTLSIYKYLTLTSS